MLLDSFTASVSVDTVPTLPQSRASSTSLRVPPSDEVLTLEQKLLGSYFLWRWGRSWKNNNLRIYMYKFLSSFLDICPRQGLDAEDTLLMLLLLPALLWPQPRRVRFGDDKFGRIIDRCSMVALLEPKYTPSVHLGFNLPWA